MRRHLQIWRSDERGVVLVMALMLMGLMGALAAGYAMMVRSDTGLRGGASRARTGFYAAEAGLNVGMAEFANIFKSYGVPTDSDFDERVISVGNRAVYYDLDEVAGYAPCTEEQPECFTTIPAGEKFAGLKTIPYRYRVTSVSENVEGDHEAELGAEFDIHNIPIFQFLAFSTDDLYIMPAPSMNLHGRIHANGNLYLNVNSGATLSIGDLQPDMPFVQVSATGQIYRGGKKSYSGNMCTGTVAIDKLADIDAPSNDLDPLDLACNGGPAPVPQATQDAYLGSLQDQIDIIEVPTMDDLERGSGVFWERADLRIVLRLDLPPASIDFGAADLCPNGPRNAGGVPNAGTLISQALYPIEVQGADGGRDTAKTTALWRFMCERRGAVFYTDVPTNNPPANPNNSTHSRSRSNYSPTFPELTGSNNSHELVYRRAGEDTNGDGVVDNWDRNDDICPVTRNAGDPAPSWRPSYCNTAYGAWPNLESVARESSWFRDVDYRRGGFFHRREGKWMYLLNVNMRALIDWNEANGGPLFSPGDYSDWGLVIFLSVQGQNSDDAENNYGVRIFDSADLNTGGGTFPWPAPDDPSGLTVVSDQAIFVQGNYNSVHKYPAAVIGDAVNVLSQGWEVAALSGNDYPIENDRKTSYNLDTGYRDVPAQDIYSRKDGGVQDHTAVCAPNGCSNFSADDKLTVNAAFISGIGPAPEGDGFYNGGLENFPRFHESWDNRRLNYEGSFVSLGLPKHQKNDWEVGSGDAGNVYDPPERFWDYDADFNEVEWLPPLTPMITYVQQRLYTRFYK